MTAVPLTTPNIWFINFAVKTKTASFLILKSELS